MNSFSSRRSAFTLIELLVVIAIIAILAAILFPVFAQAKLAAKKTVDLSNQKNIGLAQFIYEGDFDDVLPNIRLDPTNWGCNRTNSNCHQIPDLVAQVDPYIKNHDIWASPEDTLTHCDSPSSAEPGGCTPKLTGGPISYVPTFNGALNILTPYPGFDPSESYGVFGMATAENPEYFQTPATGSLNSSQLGSPAGTIIFAPMFISWSYFTGIVQQRTDQREFAFAADIPDYPGIAQCPYCWCCPSDALSMESMNGTTNWIFGDGHAKSMARTATMNALWYTDPVTANQTMAKNLFEASGMFQQ